VDKWESSGRRDRYGSLLWNIPDHGFTPRRSVTESAVTLPPETGSAAMPAYRIYALSRVYGLAGQPAWLTCGNDQQAIGAAKRLLDGFDIEVWEGGRVITMLKSTDDKR